jgi:6-phosphogluconolactonase
MIELVVLPEAEAVAAEAAGRLARLAERALSERGRAHVALAGGTTPRRAYELLASLLGDAAAGVDWWFGDERCVPPDDPASNYRLARETLLTAVPAARVHRIAGEDAPAAAAAAYERELRRCILAGAGGVPVLDAAVLGLGEDGHTASLFPGDPALDEHDRLAVAVVASKPPPDRITLTLPVLLAARAVVVLAAGAGKAQAVKAMLAGPDPEVPASLLAPAGPALVVDAAAAALSTGADPSLQ